MSRYADEITCPWCGYEYSDSWEVGQDQEDIGLLECEKCGKEFYATRNVSVTYSTVKATYGTCKACGERDVAIEKLSSSVGKYEGLCVKCGTAAYKKFVEEYFVGLETEYEKGKGNSKEAGSPSKPTCRVGRKEDI